MDKETLEFLIAEAIPRGVVDSTLLSKVRNASGISARPASRPSLLRIYKRRLKHTGGDTTLLRLTEELVDFLTTHQNDELLMIHIAGHRYDTFLLADLETSEILHWMRMFGEQNHAREA